MLLGKERVITLLIFSLLIASALNGQAGKTYKYSFDGDSPNGNVIPGNQTLIINYSVPEINIEGITNAAGNFYRISIPGHNPTPDPGKPELPVFSRLISIPGNSTLSIKISEIVSEKITPRLKSFQGVLYPRQESGSKSLQQQKSGFTFDMKEYAKHGIIESDTVRVEYIGKVRDKRLATLLIFPVRYNPSSNELEVIKSMKVEVNFIPAKGFVPAPLKSTSLLFSQSVDQELLSYNPTDVINGYSDQPVKMVIITDTAFRKSLAPFIKWKTQKGFKVKVLYRGTGYAGNTFAQMKDTLTKIYNSATLTDPAPEYLLLIGDVNRIPRSEGTSRVSDLYWGEFDGNQDYIPDIYIGRLPVADTNQLKTVLNKIIQYEKFEFADTNIFYSRALVTAGNDNAYASYMNGQVKYAVDNYLNQTNKIEGYHFYYPQSYSADDSIKKLINKGVGFINYTGHGDPSGWVDPALRSTDVALLKNKNMYPFVISNACETAAFSTTGSFGNSMIVSADKGAIGYIGCSGLSYWDEDFYWAVGVGNISSDPKYAMTGLGALDRLFHTNGEAPSDWYLSMGQVNYAGNLAVSSSTTTRKQYYWETYTLLGDPSTIPFIGTPEKFNISLPDTLLNGTESLSMIIPPFAYMSVSHFDTLWDASFASPSGSVTLEMPGLSNDSCLIVITGQNKIPLIKTIYFADVNNPFINLTGSSINDAISDDNGQADFGESLFLKLNISNLGSTNATGVVARLTSTSEFITVNNDSVYIGTLAGNSYIDLSTAFGLTISDLVPDKTIVTLNLLLKDVVSTKNYKIYISVHSPVINILNCLIDDSVTGNNNNTGEPGETYNLLFSIRNSGSSVISGTFSIINPPAGFIIPQPEVNTGLIRSGEVTVIPVSVRLSPNLPRGGLFSIETTLSCSPYSKNKAFTIPVGKTMESFEYQKMNIFPWINSSAFPWIITSNQAAEGAFSARSGIIPNSAESMLKLTVNSSMEDTLRFSVKVSSEPGYDYLYFRLNGTEMFNISGIGDWTKKKYVLNEGFNLLEWYYKKDDNTISGEDCAWLDDIIFPVTSFNTVDLKTEKIVNPESGKNVRQEQITAQIINLGIDTVKNFNLAYQVNMNEAVVQNFSQKIDPGDSVIVGFSELADLTNNGIYILKVFGVNNNDYYTENDTTILKIINTGIFDAHENPDNNIRIIPNPFRQSFRVDLESKTNDNVRISLFGQSGKTYWEENRSLLPGINTLIIAPENLPSGFYLIKISGRTIMKTGRVVKIE